jgi:hypothetical protein
VTEPRAHFRPSPPALLAAAAALWLVGHIVYVAGGPIRTDDLWWHVRIGETYATEGPWPESEPLLYTAHEDAPVQHEWLFGVGVYGVDSAFGLPGLRLVHLLLVLGIVGLVLSMLQRGSRSWSVAWAGTALFGVLAWARLWQLRPDLISIPATFIVYRLLVERDVAPSYGRVALATMLFFVWANFHSLFAVGLLILVASILGLLMEGVLRRSTGLPPAPEEGPRLRRLMLALGLGFTASLLNPRGLAQHLTFVSSSRDSAIWAIGDEWASFDPFAWNPSPGGPSLLMWLCTDVVALAFLAAALWALVQFVRRPTQETLRAVDPALLGPGLAALVAILVSHRFLWMSLFPILFVVRMLVPLRGREGFAWGAAACSVALSLAYPVWGGYDRLARTTPRSVSDYLRRDYVTMKYHLQGVRFLQEAGLRGRLFNRYPLGGFLAYWLAPEMSTFVDGRTEHYTKDVLDDYFAVNNLKGRRPGEGFRDVLERWDVDVFFGVGMPLAHVPGVRHFYTTAHLEHDPDWKLIFRALDEAIYLRDDVRNRDNLARVADYYAREGIPFDPERGFEPGIVLRDRPDWAVERGLVPANYGVLLEQQASDDRVVRLGALDMLAVAHLALGLYEQEETFDREILALAPDHPGPRRRLVFSLLKRDRPREALEIALELARVSSGSPEDVPFVLVSQAAVRRSTGARKEKLPLRQMLRLPVLSGRDRARLFAKLQEPAPLKRRDDR